MDRIFNLICPIYSRATGSIVSALPLTGSIAEKGQLIFSDKLPVNQFLLLLFYAKAMIDAFRVKPRLWELYPLLQLGL